MEFVESEGSCKLMHKKTLHSERPKHVNLIDVYIRYQLRTINLTWFVRKKKTGKIFVCGFFTLSHYYILCKQSIPNKCGSTSYTKHLNHPF